jgi:hypothetical protein
LSQVFWHFTNCAGENCQLSVRHSEELAEAVQRQRRWAIRGISFESHELGAIDLSFLCKVVD